MGFNTETFRKQAAQLDWKHWLYGLLAAFIGAVAGGIEAGLALPLLDSKDFNLDTGIKKLLSGIVVFSVLGGIKVAAAYLKQSPLPREETTALPTVQEPPKTNP